MRLAARIEGVGLFGPGLPGWGASRALLSGTAPYEACATVIPTPEALPATERRRAGKSVRLSLAAGLEAAAAAGRAPKDLVAVFTSQGGDGENVHAICEMLASDDREISPTRFHNSVHNAPAGYWGIATGAAHPADSLAAFDASFSAGLIEALARLAQRPSQPVLLIAYDAPYPQPLAATRPMVDAFATALLISSGGGAGAGIEAALVNEPVKPMAEQDLERLRSGIPAARGLPLLALLASGKPGRVVLEYLDDLALAVEVGA
jgi:hypothetical protein